MSVRRSSVTGCAVLLVLAGCASDSVLHLEVGDCLQQGDLATGAVRSVPTVECAAEHDAEVYAEHRLTGADHPGRDEVSATADAACAEAFEAFIGLPHADSELTYSSLSPTEESWQTSEDRTVLCLVLSDELVTGSLEGAAR